MSRPARAVQIGAGNFSRLRHAPALRRLAGGEAPRISLEAICDLSIDRAESFCRQFGYARAYTALDKMIDEVRPEMIYCMVDPTATAGVLERVLPLGIPTFTEKPPGVTVEQAQRLASLAEKHCTITYVAFNRRRAPALERMKRWAAENPALRYVRAEMFRNRRSEPDFGITTAIHPLDYLRYLCGDIVEVETISNSYGQSQAKDFLVSLEFESGAMADLAVLVDCGLWRERYLAQVENAIMEVTLGAGYTSEFCQTGEWTYRDNSLESASAAGDDPLIEGGFLAEHEAFIEAAKSRRLPDCSLQDALHSMKLAVAVNEEYSGGIRDFKPS